MATLGRLSRFSAPNSIVRIPKVRAASRFFTRSSTKTLRVREPDFHEHRMFRTPERDVHVHVISIGSTEIERWLMFRDRLRTNAADRQEYEKTKQQLAAHSWADMNLYAEEKTEVVERIIAAARAAGIRDGAARS